MKPLFLALALLAGCVCDQGETTHETRYVHEVHLCPDTAETLMLKARIAELETRLKEAHAEVPPSPFRDLHVVRPGPEIHVETKCCVDNVCHNPCIGESW